MKFAFENVPPRAVHWLVETVREHGVAFAVPATLGPTDSMVFRSVAGAGWFDYDGSGRLTVTITENENHFSPRMIAGGLKQLVSEAMEATA